jgi:preprotein translocase subunit SecD
VLSAPSINAREFNGEAQISGSFDIEEMNRLVTVLNSGSLPLAMTEVRFGPCT